MTQEFERRGGGGDAGGEWAAPTPAVGEVGRSMARRQGGRLVGGLGTGELAGGRGRQGRLASRCRRKKFGGRKKKEGKKERR